MKRLIAMILALCLACTLTAPALADMALEEAPLMAEEYGQPEKESPQDVQAALEAAQEPLTDEKMADGLSVEVTVRETGKLSDAVAAALNAGQTAGQIVSLKIITAPGVYINKADCNWVKNDLRSLSRLDISQADFLDDSKKQSGEHCDEATEEVYAHRIPFEAFRGMQLKEILPFSGKGASTAPTKFTEIGDWAFRDNSLKEELHIPSNITYLSGFMSNYNLKVDLSKGKIPASVTEIGNRAFGQCWAMNGDLVIPDTVKKIHAAAFYYCMAKAEVGAQYNHSTSAKNGALTLGKNLVYIAPEAFVGNSALTADGLKIPDGVTLIGYAAFSKCSGLTGKLDLNNVAEIQEGPTMNHGAFIDTGFSEIDFKNIASIGAGSFGNMANLKSVELDSDKVTYIGKQAFFNNKALETVVLNCPNYAPGNGTEIFKGNTNVKAYALNWNGSIENGLCGATAGTIETVRIGRDITGLGNYVFYNQAGSPNRIKTVDLTQADKLQTIGPYTFNQMAADGIIYLKNQELLSVLNGQHQAPNAAKIVANGVVADLSKSGFEALTKEGHLVQWCTDENCETESQDSTPQPGTTYYAKWTLCGHGEKSYKAEGAALLATCDLCGKNLGMAVLHAPEDLRADGTFKAATIVYSDDWDGGELTIAYERDGQAAEPIEAGTYIASITAGGVTASVTFTLTTPPPIVQDTGITLDQTSLMLEPGQTAKLKATLTPADATYKYIFWESSNKAVATVSDSGLVTAVAEGKATVTAKSWYGNTVTCEVTVKAAEKPEPDTPTPPDEPDQPDPWPTEGLAGFVTRLYRQALSREPDKAGHADWVRWLQDGTVDAKSCASGFIFSKEMNDKNLSDKAFVETLYKVFMDREGEASGVAFWTEYLAQGHTRREVFDGFADSKEFAGIQTSYGLG